MPKRKPYLLRLPPHLLDELHRWAGDELRSLNGQIEYLLREALKQRRHVQVQEDDETDGGTTENKTHN